MPTTSAPRANRPTTAHARSPAFSISRAPARLPTRTIAARHFRRDDLIACHDPSNSLRRGVRYRAHVVRREISVFAGWSSNVRYVHNPRGGGRLNLFCHARDKDSAQDTFYTRSVTDPDQIARSMPPALRKRATWRGRRPTVEFPSGFSGFRFGRRHLPSYLTASSVHSRAFGKIFRE